MSDATKLYYLSCRIQGGKIVFKKEVNTGVWLNGGYFVRKYGIRLKKEAFKAWVLTYNGRFSTHIWCKPKDVKSAKEECLKKLRSKFYLTKSFLKNFKEDVAQYEQYICDFMRIYKIKK